MPPPRSALQTTWALAVTEEFETVPGVFVVKAMSEENLAWHYSKDRQDRLPYAQAIHDVS